MSRAAICIPVANDPDGLRATLSAIAAMNGAADVLVVVAVDGADRSTLSVARAFAATCIELPESRGSYAARNAAVAVLPDDVEAVLFTDAGCLPQVDWLTGHLRALDQAPMSGGAVVVTTTDRMTPAEWVDRNRNLRQEAYVREDGFAATCNLGVRRKVLDAVSFDERLRSGGDRDFGLRCRDAGFELAYTPDAVIEHPARRSRAALIAKARRVGEGIAAMPPSTRPTRLPNPRPGLNLVRLARRQGVSRGRRWELQVVMTDHLRVRALRRAATRIAPVDVHVVVLLGSGWQALETFSTRWREVVLAWAQDRRIDRLTVVDHPAMRRRALVRRRLVETRPSWLPTVTRQGITLPVDRRLRVTDRFGLRRVARQLVRSWPKAQRTVVVAATPFATPLLEPLRRQGAVTAFDSVDHWSMRKRFAHMAERVEHGYGVGAQADVVTAVSAVLAGELRELGSGRPNVVGNGVDLDALRNPAPRPDFGLPDQPFAVFIGTIGGRVDVTLLTEVAALLTDVPVVVAGPATDPGVERVLRESAVEWLGPVPSHLLPGLLQAASCGLFPYRDTGAEPQESMKLLQYLAVGLPVVSCQLPGLPDGIRAANDSADFASHVRAAVARGRDPSVWVTLPGIQPWPDVADRLLTLYLEPTSR